MWNGCPANSKEFLTDHSITGHSCHNPLHSGKVPLPPLRVKRGATAEVIPLREKYGTERIETNLRKNPAVRLSYTQARAIVNNCLHFLFSIDTKTGFRPKKGFYLSAANKNRYRHPKALCMLQSIHKIKKFTTCLKQSDNSLISCDPQSIHEMTIFSLPRSSQWSRRAWYCIHNSMTVQFSSRWHLCARKGPYGHMRSTPSLTLRRSFPNVALETIPMFVW